MEATLAALDQAEKLLQDWAEQTTRPQENRLDVVVSQANFRPAAEAIIGSKWGYLSSITGLDRPAPAAAEGEPQAQGQVEVLYHFCAGGALLNLRISVPYDHAELPTICDMNPAASLYERETMELLGVQFINTPSTDHLVLPDDWPDGVYPLRKSFTGFGGSTQA
jgi:Ni,Fe-hydrogenase III component G